MAELLLPRLVLGAGRWLRPRHLNPATALRATPHDDDRRRRLRHSLWRRNLASTAAVAAKGRLVEPDGARAPSTASAQGTPPSQPPSPSPGAAGAVAAFSDLGVLTAHAEVLARLGITAPTWVQEAAVPAILEGTGQVLVQSETGSGKTLAFLLPILARAQFTPWETVIVAPTRELAVQTAAMVQLLVGPERESQVEVCAAGTDCSDPGATNPAVLVGTPKLLVEATKAVSARKIRHLVLDEADELLSVPGEYDRRGQRNFEVHPRPVATLVDGIVAVNPGLQLICVSATLGKRTRGEMVRRRWLDPYTFCFVRQFRNPALPVGLSHQAVRINPANILDRMRELLAESGGSTLLILSQTNTSVKEVTKMLRAIGLAAESGYDHVSNKHLDDAITGRGALQAWVSAGKPGSPRTVVATTDTIRGLDLQGLHQVLLLGTPRSSASYLHAAGRTGRAGRAGVVRTLVSTDQEVRRLRRISNQLDIFVADLPPEEETRYRHEHDPAETAPGPLSPGPAASSLPTSSSGHDAHSTRRGAPAPPR